MEDNLRRSTTGGGITNDGQRADGHRREGGAALECRDGTVYTGCNVENAALGSTICAERTAAVKAVSEGHTDFSRIAIWGEGRDYCMPCGACRQFLAEFSIDMEVLCAKAGGRYVSYKLRELLPHTFNY